MKHTLSFVIGTLLLTACGSKPQVQKTVIDTLRANFVTLTSVQYSASHVTLGKIERKPIERKPVARRITVNGKLDVPPQNLVIISAPMGGFVKSTDLLQGMKVKKGDVLATLENQDYIQLQQDYLGNRSRLEFLEADYIRQVELARENVTAQKNLQQSKSQYESTKAMVSGLEAKLAMLHLSPASLRNGRITSTIHLHAPINGFITTVNVNIGQFVNATDVLFKIVNLEQMHAELQVYEKDITQIAIGQKVVFQLANDNTPHTASVHLIGKEISPERTVRVHCYLDQEDKAFLPGMLVTANIETVSQEADVVPNASVANYEGKNFIFVASGNNQFKAVRINIGNSTGEFTEVQFLEPVDREAPLVTAGAFELLGLLKNKGITELLESC